MLLIPAHRQTLKQVAPEQPPPVAFVAGVLGPLIGAVPQERPREARIGRSQHRGAGTFDGSALSGVDRAVLDLASENEARKRGVDGSRLIFAPDLPQPHHLGRLHFADLALDTAPYGAHATASNSLVGVPLVIRPGATLPLERRRQPPACGWASRTGGRRRG